MWYRSIQCPSASHILFLWFLILCSSTEPDRAVESWEKDRWLYGCRQRSLSFSPPMLSLYVSLILPLSPSTPSPSPYLFLCLLAVVQRDGSESWKVVNTHYLWAGAATGQHYNCKCLWLNEWCLHPWSAQCWTFSLALALSVWAQTVSITFTVDLKPFSVGVFPKTLIIASFAYLRQTFIFNSHFDFFNGHSDILVWSTSISTIEVTSSHSLIQPSWNQPKAKVLSISVDRHLL